MKKLLCVVPALLLFAMIGAPNARGDSYTPTFSCEGPSYEPYLTCPEFGAPPTAPDVAFPSPTIDVSTRPTFPSSPVFDITLASADLPTDVYFWGIDTGQEPCSSGLCWVSTFGITDQTTGLTDSMIEQGVSFGDPTYGLRGSLTFSPVSAATPEPPPVILMLLGVGLLLMIRKRAFVCNPHVA